MTDDAVTVDSLEFVTDDLVYREAGVDFREGTRLYDSAVRRGIYLHLNGEELTFKNRLPAEFEISHTVWAMYHMMSDFRTSGSEQEYPFCCVCGDRGCAYIQ